MTAVTCDRATLAWALRAVLPHACRYSDIPQLAAVSVETDPDGTIWLAATDRYTLGVARVDGHRDPGDTARTLLPVAGARELQRRLKDGGDLVELEFYADGDLTVDYQVRYSAPPSRGNWDTFPAWRPLLGGMLRWAARPPAVTDGMYPEFLGRFAAAIRAGDDCRALTVMPVRKTGAASHSAYVVFGSDFAGAVMSTRLDSSGYDPAAVLATWRDRLPGGTS